MLELDNEYGDEEDDEEIPTSEWFLRSLEREVGGRPVLMALDTEPLPDEAFLWAGIPEDIREAVGTVLGECDRVADELFDTDGRHEARTAMRRLLSRVAGGDPAIFRRRASLAKGAATVAWLILRANEYRHIYVKDMTAAFGVSGSLSQRAEPMLRAIGVDPYHRYGAGQLGSPDFLTSTTRASIIRRRDWTLAEDDEDFTGVL